MRTRLVGAMACAFFVACGSSSSNGTPGTVSDDDAATTDETASTDDSSSSAEAPDDVVAEAETSDYPVGPYGIAVGDVLPDVPLLGYSNFDPTVVANTTPYGVTSLSDLRHAATARYGLLHIGEFW